MTAAALHAREVVFGYEPGCPVLSGLSLAVPEGTVLALLGPNGSGKSTLLRLFAGLLRPRSGRVELFGLELALLGRRAIARQVAVVPQGTLGASFFTVRELVALGRHPWQNWFATETRQDRELVAEALAAVHLTALADRQVRTLSGGERQRVQLAMALVQQTPVLLLDEPTTYLDIRHQVDLLDLVTAESRCFGRAVVMVLHDLNLAAVYADRLALLANGRLWSEGSPATVLTPDNIAAVYGIDAVVVYGVNRRPHVILHSRPRRAAARGPRVHLVGGGGAAANLLADLAGQGFQLSLGVVNRGDLDAAVGGEWGVEMALDPPACPISPEAAARCQAAMLASAAVVVANVPFGPGNLANLRLALHARRAGLPVLLVAEDSIADRDFTGGEAANLVRELLANGAEEVAREQVVGERLREILCQDR